MEEDELFFLSFLLLTGWTADMMDYGDVRCVNLTSLNYFPQISFPICFHLGQATGKFMWEI